MVGVGRRERMKEAEQLANEHWEYVSSVLEQQYKTAFIHGFKHGRESKGEAKEETKEESEIDWLEAGERYKCEVDMLSACEQNTGRHIEGDFDWLEAGERYECEVDLPEETKEGDKDYYLKGGQLKRKIAQYYDKKLDGQARRDSVLINMCNAPHVEGVESHIEAEKLMED
jgi:hypothetical protein